MTFTAKYDGTCHVCETTIRAGEVLAWDDDRRAVHDACRDRGDDLTARRPVCRTCFQERAVDGSCACEERTA